MTFEESLISFRTLMMNTALRFLHNVCDAEDAVQDACVKLWQKRDTYDAADNVAALCYRVVKNVCIDRLRRTRVYDTDDAVIENVIDESHSRVLEYNETKALFDAQLAALPAIQREVMELRANGCSFEEIAAQTGLEQSNIRCIISRVRKRLRKSLD